MKASVMWVRGVAVAMALVAGACHAAPQEGLPAAGVALVAPDGRRIPLTVEIAATPESRETGMMERRHMAGDHGMLFVWPEPLVAKFWMRNTYIPLDMLFFKEGALVGVVRDAKPLDETPVGPEVPVDAVLEVNAGFVARHKIGIGWVLKR